MSRQHRPEEAAWFKSSYSDGTGNSCVEIAHLASRVGVRDSKNATGPALLVPVAAWSDFVGLLKSSATAADITGA